MKTAAALVMGTGALLLLGSGSAFARHRLMLPQDAPAAAKADPATLKDGSLTAVIVSLEGTVEVKRPKTDADFIEAKKDMELPEGTEISTGYGSKAQLAMTGQILVEIPSLTQVAIDKLLLGKGKLDSNLNVKFGTLNIDVKKGVVKTDLKVSTPNATTSVTGTRLQITYHRDVVDGHSVYHIEVKVLDGHVSVANADGQHTDTYSAGQSFNITISDPATSNLLITTTGSADPTLSFGLTPAETGTSSGTLTVTDPTTGATSTTSGGSGGGTVIIQTTVIQPSGNSTATQLPGPPTHP